MTPPLRLADPAYAARHAVAWAAYAADARARRAASTWDAGARPPIPPNWVAIAGLEGRAAVHGQADLDGFERILGAWCKILPTLRGDQVSLLVGLYTQAIESESRRVDAAAAKIRWATWPLFEAHAPREAIRAAAARAADGLLDGTRTALLDEVYTAFRRTRRRRGR